MATHGQARRGMESDEYQTWCNMIRRVDHPAPKELKAYGHVSIAPEWRSFETFFKDMGTRPTRAHTLDRKDGALGYSPENCAWATREEQNNNRQNNVTLVYNEESMTLSQWARKLSIPYSAIYWRYRAGWSTEHILRGKP